MGEFHKIGASTDPVRRLGDFMSLPYVPRLVHSFPSLDMYGVERVLHRRFSPARFRGEWFRLTPDDVALIVAVAGCAFPADLPATLWPARQATRRKKPVAILLKPARPKRPGRKVGRPRKMIPELWFCASENCYFARLNGKRRRYGNNKEKAELRLQADIPAYLASLGRLVHKGGRPRKLTPELFYMASENCYAARFNGKRRRYGSDKEKAEARFRADLDTHLAGHPGR